MKTLFITVALTALACGYHFEKSPPPHEEKAKTARYIMHNTDWAVLGTISSFDNIKGRPFTNIASFCDGPMDNSTARLNPSAACCVVTCHLHQAENITMDHHNKRFHATYLQFYILALGVPYFYVMNQDVTVRDVLKGSLVSLSVSEALTDYCKDSSFDPEDPRCARLTLSGKMVNITGDERQFATDSLFSRHPEMKQWSQPHSFYPTKLVIDAIWLLDYFGEPSWIPVEDYFNVHL